MSKLVVLLAELILVLGIAAVVRTLARRIRIPVNHLLNHVGRILIATLLVLLVRTVSVYSVIQFVNRTTTGTVPFEYQHVLVWGGTHTVIPIALFPSVPNDLPYPATLGAMVFGVAALSIVIQGFLMPYVLQTTGTVGSMEEAIDAD